MTILLDYPIFCERKENMTDTSKYRNVSLSHATYKILNTLSKNLDPDVTLSISKTIEKIANEKVRKLNGKISGTVSK